MLVINRRRFFLIGAGSLIDWTAFPARSEDIATPVSAAVRSGINCGASRSKSGFFTYRLAEKSNATVRNPVLEFWNGYVRADGYSKSSPEMPISTPVQWRVAIVAGVAGADLRQQKATVRQLTFSGMLKDRKFVDGGGQVSADGQTVICPPGMFVKSDECENLVLAKGERYFIQTEEARSSDEISPRNTWARYDLGDAVSYSPVQSQKVYDSDWSGASVKGVNRFPGPIAVYGQGAAGSKVVMIDGDSIINADKDLLGDDDGARGYAKRALNAAGYSFFDSSVPGTNIESQMKFGGYEARSRFWPYCEAVLTDHGHNDRAGDWPGFLAKIRWHNQLLRAGLRGKKKIIRSTLCPRTTSSDNWKTLENQNYKYGFVRYPDGVQYSDYAPYLTRTGAYKGVAFDPVLDPDACYDLSAAIGASENGKFPPLGTDDGLHPSSQLQATAAASLEPLLKSLIGFSPPT